jgi:transposase-like protein
MTKCPRCHSSMLLDYTDTIEGFRRTWRCLGCGREILQDPQERELDARMLDQVRATTVNG